MTHRRPASLLRSSAWRLMVLALLLAGCGDSGIITPVDNAPLQLVLTPSDVVMNNHETVQLEMGQRLHDGRIIPLDVPVVWTSSSPAVANVDATGLLLARLPGEVTVTASSRWGDVSGRVAILPVSADLSLEVADYLQVVAGSAAPLELRARIVDSAGRPVPGVRVDFFVRGSSVSLSASSRSTGNDGYASTWVQVGERAREFDLLVSSPGLEVPAASAAAPGVGGPAPSSGPPGQLRKAVRLQVSPSHPASLEVIPGNAHMVRGEERTFTAVIRDEFGNTIETDDVRWRTVDSGVATVSSSGRVTAVVAGATQVTAEHRQGSRRVEGAGEVVVGTGALPAPAALSIVSGSGRSTSLQGEIDGLTIQVRDEAGQPLQGVATRWSVQSGTGTMVVPATSTDADGLSSNTFIAGTETGAVTVRAEVEGLAAVAFDLTVASMSLHISAPRTSLTSLGETVQLVAEARDENGNVVDTPSLTWTSSETNVASVNTSGRVIANAIGAAVISVAAACCSGDQVSISVTQEVASVQVSPSSSAMQTGSTRQFTAEARDANGSPIPGVEFRWSSTQQTVASVSSNGVVSATSDGSAGIRAEASPSGRMGEGSVNVSALDDGGQSNRPTGWRSNEPAGYASVVDEGFGYPDATYHPTGANVPLGPWSLQVSENAQAQIRSDGNGPISGTTFRAILEAGFQDGQDPARLSRVVLSQAGRGGFYSSMSMRLSSNWQQNIRADGPFTPKHIIYGVVPDDDRESAFFGWTGWRQIDAETFQMGIRVDAWAGPRRDLPLINEQAALFRRGEWVIVEMFIEFNNGTPNTGRARLWLNGVLITDARGENFPASRLRQVRPAGTHGGGVGNAPHRMFYDIDHLYVSTP